MWRRVVNVCVMLMLIVYLCWRVESVVSWSLPSRWIAKPSMLSGRVVTEPTYQQGLMRFVLLSTMLNHQRVKQRIQLSWFKPQQRVALGQYCTGLVGLKPVHSLRNPQTLLTRVWLKGFRYRAQGYIKKNNWHCMGAGSLRHRIAMLIWIPDQVRDDNKQVRSDKHQRLSWSPVLSSRPSSRDPEKSLKAIIIALATGIQAKLSPNDWQVFQRTGTSHLVAISGLHLGLVALLSYQLMFWLWRRSAKLCVILPAPKIAAVFALLSMVAYAALSGFAIPAVRALIMNGIIMFSLLLAINWPLWWRIVFAAVVVLLWRPWDILSASFWLSFAAVSWIAYIMTHLQDLKKWQAWLKLQGLMTLGLLPLSLYFFHGVSLVAFMANLIAIPYISFVVVPAVLVASAVALFHLTWAVVLFKIAAWVLYPLWFFLRLMMHIPYGYMSYWLPNGWLVLLLLTSVIFLCAPRVGRYRWLSLIGVLVVFIYRPSLPKKGQASLTMLDVGQGLAMVIRTKNHVMIYDAGPRYPTGFDAGKMIVLPYLQYLHVHAIDRVMISHGDNDHIGGLHAILRGMPVRDVMTSVPKKRIHFNTTTSIRLCYAGQHWRWDDVQFDVLYPPQGLPYQANNSSCVLRIATRHQHILLTGDIEKPAEQWLLEHAKSKLPAQILQVPHHGSRTSSTMAFIIAVHPDIALISSGFYNRFHFPDRSVLRRYRVLNVRVFNTA